MIVLDIRTGAPQAPKYPIRRNERVGILFVEEDTMPFVVMLRSNFPDTEHQQLVPEDHPAVICIDDRPWAEALLTWTPSELIERILMWFRRAARGELHDARQPLDPILMGSPLSFIIARSVLENESAEDLIAEHDLDQATILRVKRRAEINTINKGQEPICIATYSIHPEHMKRLRYAPTTLEGLATLLNARGIELYTDLTTRFTNWLLEGEGAAWRLNARFGIIIEMPIVSPRGKQQKGVDVRAFLSEQSAGEIAVALGVAHKTDGNDQSSKVGFVKRIGYHAANPNGADTIRLQSLEVHLEFDRNLATRLAGGNSPDSRKVVLVGAGALGSHLADCLIREGRFYWTIIDDDRLLPHNLARHIARNDQTSRRKAVLLADYLNAIFVDEAAVAQPLMLNLFESGAQGAAIKKSLAEADLIIDATASVLAARYLSDHEVLARRLSTFFNPTGDAVVLLAEPVGRMLTLRDLEAQYLGLVLRTGRLADHLGLAETIAYTGACRAITSRIPQSHVSLLAGLAAAGVGNAVDGTEAVISIWTLTSNNEVILDSVPVEPVSYYRALGWKISLNAGLIASTRAMRDSRLPSETGGMLFGLVDIPAKSVHLVDASPAPHDSNEQSAEFVRGTQGVEKLMEEVRRKTAGQVRYVGEWHSHPRHTSARPSSIDAQQIDWLSALMGMDSMPALMLIVAEDEIAVIFAQECAQLAEPQRAS